MGCPAPRQQSVTRQPRSDKQYVGQTLPGFNVRLLQELRHSGGGCSGSVYLVVQRDSSVHLLPLLLIVAGCLYHVFWRAQQSQVHQLII